MPAEGGFSFANFLADVFTVFVFVVWFCLLFMVFSDLFRRHDISGWGKALWVIALIIFPYLGVFAYIIFQSTGMAERSSQQAQQTREELRRVVGFSVADERPMAVGINAPCSAPAATSHTMHKQTSGESKHQPCRGGRRVGDRHLAQS